MWTKSDNANKWPSSPLRCILWISDSKWATGRCALCMKLSCLNLSLELRSLKYSSPLWQWQDSSAVLIALPLNLLRSALQLLLSETVPASTHLEERSALANLLHCHTVHILCQKRTSEEDFLHPHSSPMVDIKHEFLFIWKNKACLPFFMMQEFFYVIPLLSIYVSVQLTERTNGMTAWWFLCFCFFFFLHLPMCLWT